MFQSFSEEINIVTVEGDGIHSDGLGNNLTGLKNIINNINVPNSMIYFSKGTYLVVFDKDNKTLDFGANDLFFENGAVLVPMLERDTKENEGQYATIDISEQERGRPVGRDSDAFGFGRTSPSCNGCAGQEGSRPVLEDVQTPVWSRIIIRGKVLSGLHQIFAQSSFLELSDGLVRALDENDAIYFRNGQCINPVSPTRDPVDEALANTVLEGQTPTSFRNGSLAAVVFDDSTQDDQEQAPGVNQTIYPQWWGAGLGRSVASTYEYLRGSARIPYNQTSDDVSLASCFLGSVPGQEILMHGDFELVSNHIPSGRTLTGYTAKVTRPALALADGPGDSLVDIGHNLNLLKASYQRHVIGEGNKHRHLPGNVHTFTSPSLPVDGTGRMVPIRLLRQLELYQGQTQSGFGQLVEQAVQNRAIALLNTLNDKFLEHISTLPVGNVPGHRALRPNPADVEALIQAVLVDALNSNNNPALPTSLEDSRFDGLNPAAITDFIRSVLGILQAALIEHIGPGDTVDFEVHQTFAPFGQVGFIPQNDNRVFTTQFLVRDFPGCDPNRLSTFTRRFLPTYKGPVHIQGFTFEVDVLSQGAFEFFQMGRCAWIFIGASAGSQGPSEVVISDCDVYGSPGDAFFVNAHADLNLERCYAADCFRTALAITSGPSTVNVASLLTQSRVVLVNIPSQNTFYPTRLRSGLDMEVEQSIERAVNFDDPSAAATALARMEDGAIIDLANGDVSLRGSVFEQRRAPVVVELGEGELVGPGTVVGPRLDKTLDITIRNAYFSENFQMHGRQEMDYESAPSRSMLEGIICENGSFLVQCDNISASFSASQFAIPELMGNINPIPNDTINTFLYEARKGFYAPVVTTVDGIKRAQMRLRFSDDIPTPTYPCTVKGCVWSVKPAGLVRGKRILLSQWVQEPEQSTEAIHEYAALSVIIKNRRIRPDFTVKDCIFMIDGLETIIQKARDDNRAFTAAHPAVAPEFTYPRFGAYAEFFGRLDHHPNDPRRSPSPFVEEMMEVVCPDTGFNAIGPNGALQYFTTAIAITYADPDTNSLTRSLQSCTVDGACPITIEGGYIGSDFVAGVTTINGATMTLSCVKMDSDVGLLCATRGHDLDVRINDCDFNGQRYAVIECGEDDIPDQTCRLEHHNTFAFAGAAFWGAFAAPANRRPFIDFTGSRSLLGRAQDGLSNPNDAELQALDTQCSPSGLMRLAMPSDTFTVTNPQPNLPILWQADDFDATESNNAEVWDVVWDADTA